MNHFVHQVAKAAGISDLSAKVYGSRNGTRVIKLAIQMLHGGASPVGKSTAARAPALACLHGADLCFYIFFRVASLQTWEGSGGRRASAGTRR